MLVEQLPAFIDAQLDDSAEPHRFFLSINKTSVRNTWSAAYVDYQTDQHMLGINYCDSLDEVALRLEARIKRYMRRNLQPPRTLQDRPERATVENANITEGIPMSDTAPANDQKELTHGQKLVGLNFNPAGDPRVTKLKQLAAEQIDILEELQAEQFPTDSSTKPDYDTNLLQGDAIREVIHAQMSTVKRATWRPANLPTTSDKAAAAPADGNDGNTADPLNQGAKAPGTDAAA